MKVLTEGSVLHVIAAERQSERQLGGGRPRVHVQRRALLIPSLLVLTLGPVFVLALCSVLVLTFKPVLEFAVEFVFVFALSGRAQRPRPLVLRLSVVDCMTCV